METSTRRFGLTSRVNRATAIGSLIATAIAVSGKAHAQNSPFALTVVPGHVFVVRGASFRSGDLFALEPSGLFFLGAGRPPVAGVARAVVGVGGSGGGIGLAANLWPSCWGAQPDPGDQGFCIGPFMSLEARVERMYGLSSWRSATYVGPQLTLSTVVVLKASLGWMVDVGDRTDRHVQFGFGFGF